VEAADSRALQDVVLNKMQNITGVNQTATHIVFEA